MDAVMGAMKKATAMGAMKKAAVVEAMDADAMLTWARPCRQTSGAIASGLKIGHLYVQ